MIVLLLPITLFYPVGVMFLHLRHSPGTASHCLLARTTIPDSNRMPFYRDFAAEGASVSGVLCDFHLLDLLSQRGAISDPNRSVLCSRGES